MKKIITIILVFIASSLLINNAVAQNKKLAQTGMKFLGANVDARSSGLGTAFTSIEGGSIMMFHNPAGMARQSAFADFSMGYMTWIADIKYTHAGVSFAPFDGQYGIFGVSLLNVNYGEFFGTIRADNYLAYIETGVFAPHAMAIGLSYATALSDKFSIGANVKYANQYIGPVYTNVDLNGDIVSKDNEKDVFVFDFGLMYKTGFKSLNFGMVIRNFSQELKYEEEQFQLPLTFRIGVSMNALDLLENFEPGVHAMLVSVDAIHHRDYPEQINFGFEYNFMNTVALRAGYIYPADEQSYTLGLGLMQSFAGYALGVDYAYTPFGVFDPVHRVSLMFSL
jgi:hypothetical protein